jgi:hypothetical protein
VVLRFRTAKKPLHFSHYEALAAIKDEKRREAFEKNAVASGWSVVQLKREVKGKGETKPADTTPSPISASTVLTQCRLARVGARAAQELLAATHNNTATPSRRDLVKIRDQQEGLAKLYKEAFEGFGDHIAWLDSETADAEGENESEAPQDIDADLGNDDAADDNDAEDAAADRDDESDDDESDDDESDDDESDDDESDDDESDDDESDDDESKPLA